MMPESQSRDWNKNVTGDRQWLRSEPLSHREASNSRAHQTGLALPAAASPQINRIPGCKWSREQGPRLSLRIRQDPERDDWMVMCSGSMWGAPLIRWTHVMLWRGPGGLCIWGYNAMERPIWYFLFQILCFASIYPIRILFKIFISLL